MILKRFKVNLELDENEWYRNFVFYFKNRTGLYITQTLSNKKLVLDAFDKKRVVCDLEISKMDAFFSACVNFDKAIIEIAGVQIDKIEDV
jgi:hypothetical protein